MANKIQDLQRQILELTETIKKNGKATRDQANELDKLNKKYNKAIKDGLLSQYRKQHDQLNKSLDETRKYTQRVNKNLSETAKSTKNASNASSGFFSKLKTAGGTLSRYLIAYQAINAALSFFRELTIGSVREAIKFEKVLANLSAVAGVTGDNLKKLKDNALAVAGQTKFTAEEIVGLQTELSKLGFTSEEVIASTQSIAFAAQALGSPLETTAALIGKVRNQFGLLIEQTTEISDTLVTSINNSALSFESFGTAIQYVGPIASNLGLTLQQTVGAMASLADAGFTASRIGTGLRGILTEIGKSSADAELSLRELAEQNVSLSEAVDLVGKRNAAQLITLLKNIDVLDEANSRYYQQGRALFAAAEQADSFSGQMDILTSNIKAFQINLGSVIVDSDIFIKTLGLLSKQAQQTALGFRELKNAGFEGLQEDVDKVINDGIDPLTQSLERLVESGSVSQKNIYEIRRAFEGAAEMSKELGRSITPSQESLEKFGFTQEQFASLQGYNALLETSVESQREQIAITKGQESVNSKYKDSIDALVKSARNGNNVNKKANELNEEIQKTIESYSNTLKTNTTLSKERRLEYESSISALQRYREQLTNVIISEEQIRQIGIQAREKQKAAEARRLKEKISDINKETAETVAAINERAALETFVAKTAEERAKIEAQRQADVSAAYSDTAEKIGELNAGYRDNKSIITDAVEANEKLAKILGSQVVKDVQKTIKDYSEEIKKLNKDLEDGQISQEEYNAARDRQYDGLKENIEAFKELNNVSPEVAALFDKLAAEVLSAGYALDTTSVSTKKTKKDFEDFLDELKKGGWADYAKESVEALGESLSAFNDTSLENLKNSEQAKLDVVKNRYETEENILKAQLENQLITESQYRKKQRDLKKAQLAEENSINQKIFEAEKKQDRNDALLEGAEAIAQSYIEAYKNYEPATAFIVGSIGAGIAAAQSSAQVAAINKRKFFPKKFADGGVVNGPSHEQGGVSFTVQGQSGYEMEGGEFIVNKKATAMHRDLLERINSSYATQPTVGRVKFAQGGLVPSNTAESVDYLKAIAEATTSTAIGVNKPVRAFVANKDLRSNDNERRLRDRNDRI